MKSRDAKRSQHLIPILQASKRVLLLSGTPVLSKPVEIFNVMRIVRPDVTPNFHEFTGRYCDPQMSKFRNVMDYNGATCT